MFTFSDPPCIPKNTPSGISLSMTSSGEQALADPVLVVDGVAALDAIEAAYGEEVRAHARALGHPGYQLKAIPRRWNGTVRIYRYWYRYTWNPAKKNHDWTYVGKRLPSSAQPGALPEDPLAGVPFQIVGPDLLLSRDDYERLRPRFKGRPAYRVGERVEAARPSV
jgi:hypothetical protein